MVLAKMKPRVLNANGSTHHGVPVLEMHVGDVIPTPRAPERYAVLVTPDLARYLLTFNHPNNRNRTQRRVALYARDMDADMWQFSPEPVLFSTTGVLMNGQNRLMAVTETGKPQWLMLDFGWPITLMGVLDRGKARTTADALHVRGVANASNVAAIATKVWQYDRIVGQPRSFSGLETPSSASVAAIIEADEESYQDAARTGKRTYAALEKGGSPAVWGTCYYIIARADSEAARRFFDEVADGTGAPGTATRVLAQWFLRRPVSVTRSGDDREPIELIIRAFNAWSAGKTYSAVRTRGFALSHVKAR
jgi:hypothetical protein